VDGQCLSAEHGFCFFGPVRWRAPNAIGFRRRADAVTPDYELSGRTSRSLPEPRSPLAARGQSSRSHGLAYLRRCVGRRWPRHHQPPQPPRPHRWAVGVIVGIARVAAGCTSASFNTSPKERHPGDCVDRKPPTDPEGDFAQAIDRLGRRGCGDGARWTVVSAQLWSPPQDSSDLHPACRSDAAAAGQADLPVVGDWERVPGDAMTVILALLVPQSYSDSTSPRWRVCLAGSDPTTHRFGASQ
jgi:hypothetical protein